MTSTNSATDRIIDHLIEQNKELLHHTLDNHIAPNPNAANKLTEAKRTIDELEQELAEANRTITNLKTEQHDYETLRETLFKERDENHEQVQKLKTDLELANNQAATTGLELTKQERHNTALAQQLQETHQALDTTLQQLQTEQAKHTELTKTDRENALRHITNALEKFDENPDAAFDNLTRAKATLTKGAQQWPTTKPNA